jgi:hypothetical protein
MRHLFLTVHEVAFGEVLLGVRLAAELAAAGDEVLYLAPRAVAPALRGAPVRFGAIDYAMRGLDTTLQAVAAETRVDSVCLVDAQATFASFQHRGLDCGRLLTMPAPVVALDAWDLAAAGLFIDFGAGGFSLDPRVLSVPRLVPVPFARPTSRGAYCALPVPTQDPAARSRGRARLDLAESDAMVLFPTAAWQHMEATSPEQRAGARAVPALLAAYVEAVGATLVHVGPWRLPGVEALGAAYRHLPQLPRAEFADMVAAADLLLSLNAAATSISSALAARLPVLLLHHDAVPAQVGPRVARFLAGAPAPPPFRAWPYGLRRLLGGALLDNPFSDAVPSIELLDEPAVLAAATALLRDPARIADARQRSESYAATVRALPSGRERYAEVLRMARSASS